MVEALWENGPILGDAPGVFPTGTDSILLSDFARPGPSDQILDLGTGSGILPVLLLHHQPRRSAVAVELDAAACCLARKNFRRNHLESQLQLLHGDLRQYRQLLSPGIFDLTVSNPPYFPTDSGTAAKLEYAKGDSGCTLDDLCSAAAWGTRWGGRFCVVFRPERLCDLMVCFRSHGLEPKRLRPVFHSARHPVSVILLEARRGGKPGLRWESSLLLYTSDGLPSSEMRRIYHIST